MARLTDSEKVGTKIVCFEVDDKLRPKYKASSIWMLLVGGGCHWFECLDSFQGGDHFLPQNCPSFCFTILMTLLSKCQVMPTCLSIIGLTEAKETL